MLAAAAADEPIVIKAQMPVFRSFVHVEELMAVLLFRLNRVAPGAAERFDTCGREIVELHDLARAVLRVLGRPESDIERSYDPGLPADWYVGDSREYQVALTAAGLQPMPLADIILDSAAQTSHPAPWR